MDTQNTALSYRLPTAVGVIIGILALAVWIPFLVVRAGASYTAATPVEVVVGTQDSETDAIAVGAPGTSVVDEAGIIHVPTLTEGLADIGFREPVRVVLFTQRPDQATLELADPLGDEAFNERVLDYMRSAHPEVITADGQKWADGVFIFGIDPEGRYLGSYLGEDIAVDLDTQYEIQQAAADSAREANWTQAALDGIEAGAGALGYSVWADPVFYLILSIVVLTLGAVVVWWLVKRVQTRRANADRLQQAERAYAQVTMVIDETHLHAATIPEESTYGAIMLAAHERFKVDYRRVHEEIERLNAVPAASLSEKSVIARIDTVLLDAEDLLATTQAIADTNELLNRHPGWEDAWSRQTEPLLEDLRAVTRMDRTGERHPAVKAQLEQLDRFATWAPDRLHELHAALSSDAGELTPDEVLDHLKQMRIRLSENLQALYEAQVPHLATDAEERAIVDREFTRASQQHSRRPRRGILDYSPYDNNLSMVDLWTVSMFTHALSSSQSSVTTHRQAQESNSSSYGSSGGSFSGSGSSSRF